MSQGPFLSAPDRPPEEIGGVRIGGVLGVGGLSRVYRGRRIADGQAVAIKLMHLPDGNEVRRKRALRESVAAAHVSHPGVVKVHNAGIEGDRAFVIMELIEGIDLSLFIERKGPMPAKLLRSAGCRLIEALAAIHAAGCIHRDLKPANVLADPVRRGFVIVDFGLSKMIDGSGSSRLTATGIILGTPGYLAPEQADGLTEPSFPSDVYGLCATLWTAGSGRPPYSGDSPYDIIRNQLAGPPSADIIGLPRLITEMLRAGLETDPAARPKLDDLRHALSGTAGIRTTDNGQPSQDGNPL